MPEVTGIYRRHQRTPGGRGSSRVTNHVKTMTNVLHPRKTRKESVIGARKWCSRSGNRLSCDCERDRVERGADRSVGGLVGGSTGRVMDGTVEASSVGADVDVTGGGPEEMEAEPEADDARNGGRSTTVSAKSAGWSCQVVSPKDCKTW